MTGPTIAGMTLYALGDKTPSIHPSAFIHPDAVIIGDVTIGAESSVWPTAVLRGDHGRIIVGDRTSIQDGTIIHCTRADDTIIGDDCTIGHRVHLEGCTIEDGSLVGSGSVVLRGVVVRTGAQVGAQALVPPGMEVPTGALALGVPAKLRLDSVNRDSLRATAEMYVHNTHWYAADLRRLD